MADIPLDEIASFVVFWIPWLLAVNELRSHFRHGVMKEYLRRGTGEDAPDIDDRPATRTTSLQQDPVSYRLLLLFYSAVTILVPALTVYVLYSRQAG